jgi:hypothetical protein
MVLTGLKYKSMPIIPGSVLGRRSNKAPLTGINLDTFFDTLNLQGHSFNNFILEAPNKVTQWNDLSGNNNHATQATSSRKPIYNSATGMIFDYSDDRLALQSEVNFGDGAIYLLIKNNNDGVFSIITGAQSENGKIMVNSGNLGITLENGANGSNWSLQMNGLYKLIGIRRLGSTFKITVNDRTITVNSGSVELVSSGLIKIFNLGFATVSGGPTDILMKAVCVHSQQVDDANTF